MRIVFLDVDGPMATLRSHLAHHGRGGLMQDWDDVAAAFLRRICAQNIRIVISSTWRIGMNSPYKMKDGTVSALTEALEGHDLIRFLRLPNWRTPDLAWTPQHSRGKEIEAYLKANPDITEYRIIDDDCDMLPEQEPFFIHVNGHDGMTGRNMIDLLDWAEGKDVDKSKTK